MEKINVGDRKFSFVVDYCKVESLRRSFNSLTFDTYGFDFESWFNNGYWGDRYIPYSILDGDKIVSNVSVNPIDFVYDNKKFRFTQLGTVMTDKDYRGLGLNKYLIKRVLNDYEDISNMIYLYANNNVLNYYGKLGFVRTKEYQASIKLDGNRNFNKETSLYKLNMDIIKDRLLLERIVSNKSPISRLAMVNNDSLIMFYATYFMGDKLYYIEEIDTIVIMDVHKRTLNIYDIFTQEKDLMSVMDYIIDYRINKILFGFTPLTNRELELSERQDENLFVYKNKGSFITDDRLMLPKLSQA